MMRLIQVSAVSLVALAVAAGTAIGSVGTQAPHALPAPGLYVNAEGSPVFDLIASAEQDIDIEIYTMKDPDFRAAVRAALAKGRHVRLIKDMNSYEEKCDVFGDSRIPPDPSRETAECKDMRKLVGEIKDAGGEAVPFNMKELCGGTQGDCFEHGKMVIIDGSTDHPTAMISSGNFDSTNLCNARQNPAQCDRDYSFVIQDKEVVVTLEKIFNNDLNGQAYDLASLIKPVSDRLTVSPFSLAPLVAFIKSATKSIEIENQYITDPRLVSAILDMAPKVSISVTVSSPCAFGRKQLKGADKIRAQYTAFDAAGISSVMFDHEFLINGFPGYLHAKAIVVDGTRAWMGSVNGSEKALSENREFGMFFDNPTWVQKLADTMRADHSDPRNETWQQSLDCVKDPESGLDSEL